MTEVFVVEEYVDYEGSTFIGVYSEEAYAAAALVMFIKKHFYSENFKIEKDGKGLLKAEYSDRHVGIRKETLDVFPQ